MTEYSPLTAEKFYKHLIANKIILKRADIESIVKEVEKEYPQESDVVRIQKAYEKVEILYNKVHPLREAKTLYAGKWNGADQRKTTA